MNNLFLCRGKSVEDSNWMYGYYCPKGFGGCNVDCILPHNTDNHIFWGVDSTTVGRYVGFEDKNGKKVFEGDIHEYNGNYWVIQFGFYIEYNSDTTGYGFYLMNKNGRQEGFLDDDMLCSYLNIIGNVYDNPELMEKSL